ncbi:hypothetical protein E3J79_03345 [Candidatus Dependentiae bacterium]|nr:MAG: hypothetical protein E3J79_03345 [Candidatus Dependentiae bacterium]
MNNTTKLLLTSLIMAGTAVQAVHEGYLFNIQNESGKGRFLYIRFLNPQGQIQKMLIPAGADLSTLNMPQIISVYNPVKEDSDVGLVLQRDQLIGKKIYLEAKLLRKGVDLRLKKGIKDNIDKKSFLEAKKTFNILKRRGLEQPSIIE